MSDPSQAASPLPQRRPAGRAPGGPASRGAANGGPANGGQANGRPGPVQADGVLPRRTATAWRVGRHRSMHRLSVASDAPGLILAVPGPTSAADRDLVERIAGAAAESCPGVTISVGFLADGTDSLAAALAAAPPQDGGQLPRAVVVPLLAGPHPEYDPQVAATVGAAAVPVMVAPHLGPHPLLAGALHDRLSEAGLARVSRALGLSISAGTDGVLVIADRGAEAVSDAGLTAILLAARLAAPAQPASLGDPASIQAAVAQLRAAGAARPAIAPCVIGPETNPAELEQLSDAIGAPCAAPLGSHQAIAQLVAARYGEALARMAAVSH